MGIPPTSAAKNSSATSSATGAARSRGGTAWIGWMPSDSKPSSEALVSALNERRAVTTASNLRGSSDVFFTSISTTSCGRSSPTWVRSYSRPVKEPLTVFSPSLTVQWNGPSLCWSVSGVYVLTSLASMTSMRAVGFTTRVSCAGISIDSYLTMAFFMCVLLGGGAVGVVQLSGKMTLPG
jgi:hypothetical protein